MTSTIWQARLALLLVAATFAFAPSETLAYQVLVADRSAPGGPIPGREPNVYRYNSNGQLLGSVIVDTAGLELPTGLALSPDNSALYVSSSGNDTIIRYDYNVASGQATNPTVFADAMDGLFSPSAIKFSQDGSTLFVSNLGDPTLVPGSVLQFDATGTLVGSSLSGGSIANYSGLDFAPTGELLVGGFSDSFGQGGVLKSNAGMTVLVDLASPSLAISGASGIAVAGDDLYVAGLFVGSVARFDVNTGIYDPSFIVNIANSFPQDIRLDPSSDGLLVGLLGTGEIARFDFDGNRLDNFATASFDGFLEATAFVVIVPEPASMVLLGGMLVGLVGWRLRRTSHVA